MQPLIARIEGAIQSMPAPEPGRGMAPSGTGGGIASTLRGWLRGNSPAACGLGGGPLIQQRAPAQPKPGQPRELADADRKGILGQPSQPEM
jgi:hypothetical protein